MDNSEPVTEKVEVIEAMDDSSSGSDHKVCDIENKCSEENVVKSPQNLQIEHTTESSNREDSNNIEQNTLNIVDSGSYNRKRVREKSRKLTRLLQDHEKMLRRNFNQGMKQILKCKSLTTFTDEKYIVIVSNFPKFWSCFNIKHYIEAASGLQINDIKVVEDCGLHEVVKVTFDSFDEAKQVIDKLNDNEVEGIKLGVELKVVNDEVDNNKSDSAIKADPLQWSPDLDVWEIDPKGLYGLKEQFLKSLGIEPPIDKWIQVSNFRCEKSELRDILELAGQVLMCTVTNFGCRRAKVMYGHPLEAVQAISMLNGQKLYGQTLKLEMDRCPNDTIVLPKGLNSIGMGLGDQGRPLRNVFNHYKRYVKGASSSINPQLFSDTDDNRKSVKKTNKARNTEVSKEKVSIKMKNVTELFDNEKDVADNCNEANGATISAPVMDEKTLPNVVSTPPKNGSSFAPDILNTMSAKVNSGVTGSRIPVVMPSTSTMVGSGNAVLLAEPNFGVCIPRKACSPQSQPVVFRPGLVQVGMMRAVQNAAVTRTGLSGCARPGVPPVRLNLGTFSVRMTNLPLTTTFPLLYEKLSACGQIVSLQFTTPGCAVVSFANQAHAERCIHQFNMLNVDGHVINAMLM